LKVRKKGLIAVSVSIVAAVILLIILSPFIRSGINGAMVKKYTDQDLKSVDNINIIGHCVTVDGLDNSVAGVKEAVRLGADAVVVDICFLTDGTPVMCSDYSNVNSSPLLEDLFKAMNEDTYLKLTLYLNIVQLSSLSVINKLAVQYSILDRIFLIGIDSDRYGMITNDDTIIPLLLDYSPTTEDLNNAKNNSVSAPQCISEYGASGLIIESKNISSELIAAYNDLGITVIVDKFSSSSSVCKALISGADKVYVNDISETRKILDSWIEKMQQRNESSVEQSINNLSTTKK
jgi:hypothetical protein